MLLRFLDYVPSGPDLQFLTTVNGDSWPVPELDSIGLEALPQLPLINSNDIIASKDSDILAMFLDILVGKHLSMLFVVRSLIL